MGEVSRQASTGTGRPARTWRGRELVAPTPLFGAVAAAALVFATVAALWLAPTESTMGDVQRLFYFHMPSAWIALGPAFTCVFAFGITYLVKRDLRWDRYASAAAEIGVVFTSITLITGPLWAKPVWGVFWTWEPRLTTTLVLWFIYVGYLLLRWVAPPGHKRARLAAVYGIAGWIDVPIVFLSIWWWRAVHPNLLRDSRFGMDGTMLLVLMFCLATFTLLFVYLLFLRVRMSETSARLDALEIGREEGGAV